LFDNGNRTANIARARDLLAVPFRAKQAETSATAAADGPVPVSQHQPDLFAPDTNKRQKLSPLVDSINDRYGRCAIGFGLFSARRARFQGPCRLSPGAGELGVLTAALRYSTPRRTRLC
jgi:hypothetical protein